NKLSNAHKLSSEELTKLDFEFGDYIGRIAAAFIKRQKLKPNLIASHGHTVFHNPKENYTLQIGKAATIATHVDCKVVSDFRSQDVAMGGQGAPLVPIGDELLFSEYDACINLGGVANISAKKNSNRIAWDIGFCNMPMNNLMLEIGKAYDKDGINASKGSINKQLLEELNNLEYYFQTYPKSIGREQFEEIIKPIIKKYNSSLNDKLRTWVEHISEKIAIDIGSNKNVLLTGGGAFNLFLISRIKEKSESKIIIPSKQLIDSKEALIFAFLGVLRMENEINILSSVTGAKKDHCSGSIN
ncbi:MAG: anhydro-N-acetylmuramic acid kinase, partial [Bacteroidetes bacterium]